MKVFIDIETVPQYESFSTADLVTKELFDKKFSYELSNQPAYVLEKERTLNDHYRDKAGLFAEFGKIVCVSMGYVSNDSIKTQSFYGENENDVLVRAASAIEKASGLVAHNGKDFDYPWLCRRMMANGIILPTLLQIQNLKPWEIKLEDTMEMWKFGQFQHRASLALLCNLFGLPSPKNGMDGSKVAEVFYQEKDYKKIAEYCEGDVIALINVYRKMNYQRALTDEKVKLDDSKEQLAKDFEEFNTIH